MAEPTEAKTLPEAEKKKEQSLPFYQLFSFADKYDWLLMVSGSLGAVIHGSSMPVFFLLFGEMVNGFGKNQADLKKMTEEVSKVCYPIHQICQISNTLPNLLRSEICILMFSFPLLCSMLCILCILASLFAYHPMQVRNIAYFVFIIYFSFLSRCWTIVQCTLLV